MLGQFRWMTKASIGELRNTVMLLTRRLEEQKRIAAQAEALADEERQRANGKYWQLEEARLLLEWSLRPPPKLTTSQVRAGIEQYLREHPAAQPPKEASNG